MNRAAVPEGETEPPLQEPPSRVRYQYVLPFSSAGLFTPNPANFRRRFFPQTSQQQWNDWRWQLRNRIDTLQKLERYLLLTDAERGAFMGQYSKLPLAVTPYYLSLIDPVDATQALRKSVIPTRLEHVTSAEEADDPLSEDRDSPVPGLVHRYPDRVLFLSTSICSTYCRYCTRSRMVGGHSRTPGSTRQRWERCIEYIRNHPEVRDVLVSGGDPLTLGDEPLTWLLSRLRAIPHVEILRVGSKVPAVLPQRVTRSLTQILRRYHPIWLSLHFTHPDELTPESKRACCRLADAGIPLGSQTVLLKGINDEVEPMRRLCQGLLRMRVRPYYLYQCDPIRGTTHFRTPVEKGLEIIRGLRGHTTGYAVPSYVIDAPGGGGKIPLLPDYYQGRTEDGNAVVLKNYADKTFFYPDPVTAD